MVTIPTHPLPLFVHFLNFVCIYPPAVCMHTSGSSRSQRTDRPLLYIALTSVGLCLSFVEQCTHARTTLNTHLPSAHVPSALTQLTDTAHSHNALIQSSVAGPLEIKDKLQTSLLLHVTHYFLQICNADEK